LRVEFEPMPRHVHRARNSLCPLNRLFACNPSPDGQRWVEHVCLRGPPDQTAFSFAAILRGASRYPPPIIKIVILRRLAHFALLPPTCWPRSLADFDPAFPVYEICWQSQRRILLVTRGSSRSSAAWSALRALCCQQSGNVAVNVCRHAAQKYHAELLAVSTQFAAMRRIPPFTSPEGSSNILSPLSR
jgi:hypothetical protein